MQTRPLSYNNDPTTDDCYVITLVDKRYYWQFAQSAQNSFGQTFGSWTELFANFSLRVGQTIVFTDPVDVDYLAPTDRWTGERTYGVQTTYLIDAACHMIGSRLVFSADGVAAVQRPTTTNRDVLVNYHTTYVLDRHGGGPIPTEEVSKAVPQYVSSVFTGSPPEIESISLISLLLTLYGSATAAGNGTAWIWVDGATTLTAPQKTALATQAARDWYLWQMSPLDAQYGGFLPVPASGYAGHMEYWHTADEGVTRIVRPPMNYGAEGRGYPRETSSSGGGAVGVVASGSQAAGYTVTGLNWNGSAWVSDGNSYTPCFNTAGSVVHPPGTDYTLAVGTMVHVTSITAGYAIEPCTEYAKISSPGLVSTLSQEFKGFKRFRDYVKVNTAQGGAEAWAVKTFVVESVLSLGQNHPSLEVVTAPGGTGGSTVYIGQTSSTLNATPNITGGLAVNGGGSFVGQIHTWDTPPPFSGALTQVVAQIQPELGGYQFVKGLVGGQDKYVAFASMIPSGTGVLNRSSTLISGAITADAGTVLPQYTVTPGGAYGRASGFAVAGYSGSIGGGGAYTFYTGVTCQRTFAASEGGTAGEVPFIHSVDVVGGIVTRWDVVQSGGGRVDLTGTGTAVPNQTVHAQDTVTRTAVYLDPTMALGDKFTIVGVAAGEWEVKQRAGQTIRGFVAGDSVASSATTTGTAGVLRGMQYAAVEIECTGVTAGVATDFIIIRNTGRLTFV